MDDKNSSSNCPTGQTPSGDSEETSGLGYGASQASSLTSGAESEQESFMLEQWKNGDASSDPWSPMKIVYPSQS